MEHAGAAIMAGREESVEAERRHDLDLVLRHGAERIAGMVGTAGRLLGIAVAAQVGGDHRELGAPARGAILCQETWVNGLPCMSSSGGPVPPRHRDDARAAGPDLAAASKPSNTGGWRRSSVAWPV